MQLAWPAPDHCAIYPLLVCTPGTVWHTHTDSSTHSSAPRLDNRRLPQVLVASHAERRASGGTLEELAILHSATSNDIDDGRGGWCSCQSSKPHECMAPSACRALSIRRRLRRGATKRRIGPARDTRFCHASQRCRHKGEAHAGVIQLTPLHEEKHLHVLGQFEQRN